MCMMQQYRISTSAWFLWGRWKIRSKLDSQHLWYSNQIKDEWLTAAWWLTFPTKKWDWDRKSFRDKVGFLSDKYECNWISRFYKNIYRWQRKSRIFCVSELVWKNFNNTETEEDLIWYNFIELCDDQVNINM